MFVGFYWIAIGEAVRFCTNQALTNELFRPKSNIQKINYDPIFLLRNITLRINPLFQLNVLKLEYVVIVVRRRKACAASSDCGSRYHID